jgi:hypothetical protein
MMAVAMMMPLSAPINQSFGGSATTHASRVTGDTHAQNASRQNMALCPSASSRLLGLCRKARLAFVKDTRQALSCSPTSHLGTNTANALLAEADNVSLTEEVESN